MQSAHYFRKETDVQNGMDIRMRCALKCGRSEHHSSASTATKSIASFTAASADTFAEACITSARSGRPSSVDTEHLEHPI